MSRVGVDFAPFFLCVTLMSCRGEAPPPAASPDVGGATRTGTITVTPTTTAARLVAPHLDARASMEKEGYAFVDARVESSVEAAITGALGNETGRPLVQVVNRALVWWLSPATDLRPGDRVEVVYRLRPPEEPVVHAVWFESQKLGKKFEAVRFTTVGAKYARWYQPDGTELEKRLESSPIADYEQITSLINDGRRHKGVDFKCSVGTDVFAPWDGNIVRKNWGRANGNCVDLGDPKTGLNAYFLHLSEIDPSIQAGTRVKKGQVIGKTGNTGHSTAPHLHYQIVRGEKVMDPFRVHATTQAKAPDSEIPLIQAELAKLARMRTPSHVATGDL